MDFAKLNFEFTNMQNVVKDYNRIINLVNFRLKDNLRNVSKLETKIKNTKNKLEKDLLRLYITSVKCENEFLENLIIKEKVSNVQENINNNTV